MTSRETNGRPEAVDYIGALKLAVEAGADVESAYALIQKILEDAPQPPGSALWPTRLLVEAIQNLGASVDVP
jgi:hypothetical protein